MFVYIYFRLDKVKKRYSNQRYEIKISFKSPKLKEFMKNKTRKINISKRTKKKSNKRNKNLI